jgi:hypothetical protein
MNSGQSPLMQPNKILPTNIQTLGTKRLEPEPLRGHVKPINITSTIAMLAILVPALACTWVPLTSEGENVRVLQASAVTDCQKVGKVTSKTSDRIIIFARTDRKVREELESLSRNEAVGLNGDAIVPIGIVTDGRQTFEVYRCETN